MLSRDVGFQCKFPRMKRDFCSVAPSLKDDPSGCSSGARSKFNIVYPILNSPESCRVGASAKPENIP